MHQLCPYAHLLTWHNGLPIPFPVFSDADKLLSQAEGNICVLVDKHFDCVPQGHRCKVLNLKDIKTLR